MQVVELTHSSNLLRSLYSLLSLFAYNRNEIPTYTVGTAFWLKIFGFLTDLYTWNLLIMHLRTKKILDTVLCDQNRSKNIPSTDPSNIFDDLIRSNSKSTNLVFTIFFTNICGVFFHLLMHSWEKRSHWSKLFFDR